MTWAAVAAVTSSFGITQRKHSIDRGGRTIERKRVGQTAPRRLFQIRERDSSTDPSSPTPRCRTSFFLLCFDTDRFSIDFDRTFVPRPTKLRTTCIRFQARPVGRWNIPDNDNRRRLLPICSCNSVTQIAPRSNRTLPKNRRSWTISNGAVISIIRRRSVLVGEKVRSPGGNQSVSRTDVE